jgi:hypothetical protein
MRADVCDTCSRVWNSHCKNCSACYPDTSDYNHREDCPTLLRRQRRRANARQRFIAELRERAEQASQR